MAIAAVLSNNKLFKHVMQYVTAGNDLISCKLVCKQWKTNLDDLMNPLEKLRIFHRVTKNARYKGYEFIVKDTSELYANNTINAKMRAITLEWMASVVFDPMYRNEYSRDDPCIFQTAVKYLDMMLKDGGCTRANFQSIATASISLAMKMHGRYYTNNKELCFFTAGCCSPKQLFRLEFDFLQKHGTQMTVQTVGVVLIDLFKPYLCPITNTLCIVSSFLLLENITLTLFFQYLYTICSQHDHFSKLKSKPLAVAIYALACTAIESVEAATERVCGVNIDMSVLPAIILDINTIWAIDNTIKVDKKEKNLKFILHRSKLPNPCNIKCLNNNVVLKLTSGLSRKRKL